jgi:hypothetical protein
MVGFRYLKYMKTKTKIVRSFLENHEAKTIKDISKTIKADYRITHTATQRLLIDKILLSKKVGSSTLCNLNPEYCGSEIFIAEEERKDALFQDRNLKQLHKDLMKKLENLLFVILFIPTKTPNINLLFISNEPLFKKKVDDTLSLIPLQTHTTVLTTEEFKKTQHLHQNAVVLHNVESYYLLKQRSL